jgi:hypothetical protein
MNDLSIRRVTDKDYLDVAKIISSQPTMFGTDITHLHAHFSAIVMNQSESWISLAAECNGELVGVMRLALWENSPSWSVGCNFTKAQRSLNYSTNRLISLELYRRCMEIAEENNRYDGYIILPDLTNNVRKNMHLEMSPWIKSRYNVLDVEIIPPMTMSKWTIFQTLSGKLNGLNLKQLVVRHSMLREEYKK